MELFNPASSPQFNQQSAAYTGTAGTTTGWAAGPQGVLLTSTSSCYVVVGEGTVATTSNGTYLPPYTPIPFITPTGSGKGTGAKWTVSAIQIADAGTIYAKPCNIR